MKIKYCPIEGGNFGDTLNTMVWDRLFPDLTQRKEGILVYGIGTLLDGRHDKSLKKIVLGSGLGEANAALQDPNWDFRWVRGPLSAHGFGLSADLALGDPAVLWPELQSGCGGTPNGPIGLIPHYRTWDSFDWVTVATNAGMVAINPRQSPTDVMAQTRACSRILAESLHGAICADAMAIPWAPCILAHRFNTFKWLDWLATINRPFAPLVADRPLVRSISKPKAMANRLARLVRYKAHTRHPFLRATACATLEDAQRVSEALARYARDDSHFACSRPSDVDRQRQRMLAACSSFANEYGLAFTP
jgi:succinoglycan biosynthesis protein ExoV